jgi:hypothetical protein
MTPLLQQAFAEASKLPAAEQDVLATRLLAELGSDAHWDQTFAPSSAKLVQLAE